MDLTERIKNLIGFLELSPTSFADQIEVPRPIISHILSGRNKASLEVVQKILIAFPGIQTDWLLLGAGKMQKEQTEPSALSLTPDQENGKNSESAISNRESRIPDERMPEKEGLFSKPDKKPVEKVVFFFRDGTFREYYPEA